jgi:hypothetical protein
MTESITFILPTRNDEYSCSSENKEEEQIKKILLPIISSKINFPNSKFIIVEYCPKPDKKSIKELLKNKINNVKIVTIKNNLQHDLENDFTNKKMNFYEHVSKHIGILVSDTKYICVLNQDVILSNKNINILLDNLKQDKICLAKKCKISYDCMKLEIKDILSNVYNNNYPYTEVGLWGNGDFLMLSKELYTKIGGLLMAHQNWAIDNEILLRSGLLEMNTLTSKTNIQFTRPYEIICPQHETDGLGRPFVGDTSDPYAKNAKLISQNIVDKINDLYYIEKVEEL